MTKQGVTEEDDEKDLSGFKKAGSLMALPIPPILELAWIEHLEYIESQKPGVTSPPPSPAQLWLLLSLDSFGMKESGK